MSTALRRLFLFLGLTFAVLTNSSAQAPDSVAGRAAEMRITYGDGPFASYGSSRLLMSATDNSYGLVRISGDVASSYGTYAYSKTGYNSAVATVVDSVVQVGQRVALTFSSASEGTFLSTIPGVSNVQQRGTFRLYGGPAPASVKGMTFDVQVDEGADPFSRYGYFKLRTDSTSDTYQIYGGYGVTQSEGTYVYTPKESGTSTIILRDSQTGASMSQTLSWDTSTAGAYVVRDAEKRGYQAGTFKVIAISRPPVITRQPASVTIAAGSAALLSVTVSSSEAPSYQWRKAGVAIPGAVYSSLLIGPASASDAGSYSVSVANSSGTVLSTSASVAISATPSPGTSPASIAGRAVEITVRDASYDFTVGEKYRLLISSTGDTYGTVDLSGGTSGSFGNMTYRKTGAYTAVFESMYEAVGVTLRAFLYFSSANEGNYVLTQPGTPGEYEVGSFRVFNGKAPSSISGTSFEVLVQAGRYPYASSGSFKIRTSPINETYEIYDGIGMPSSTGTYLYSSGDQGNTSITLRDSKGGAVLSHTLSWETASSGAYVVGDPTTGVYQAGTFKVLAVMPRPVITTQPAGASVVMGSSVALRVTATSVDPVSYQWRKGGVPITGATNPTLTVTPTGESSAGVYDVVVSSASGIVTSAGAEIRVVFPAKIVTPPVPAFVDVGGNVTFSVAVSGTAPFSFKWRKNGVLIPSATTDTLALSGVKAADFGSYTVEVTNSFGSDTSVGVNLSKGEKVVITTQPSAIRTRENSAATFTVTAAGTEPLSYQWKKDGNVIPGATRASLTISRATPMEAGAYEVLVYNAFGNATSVPAQLVVAGEKGITLIDNPGKSPTPSLKVIRGSNGSLSMSVDAADPSVARTTYRILRFPVMGPPVPVGPTTVVPALGNFDMPLRIIAEPGTYAVEFVRQYADGSNEIRVLSETFLVEAIPVEAAAGVYELLLEEDEHLIPDGANYRGTLVVTVSKSGSVTGRLLYNEAPELSGSDDPALRVYTPVTRSFSGVFTASKESTQKLVCSPKLGIGTQSGRQQVLLELDFTTAPISLSAKLTDRVSLSAGTESQVTHSTSAPTNRNLTKLEGIAGGSAASLSEAVGRYNVGSLLETADVSTPGKALRALLLAQILPSGRVLWVSRVVGRAGSGSAGLRTGEDGSLLAAFYEGRLTSTSKLHQTHSLLGMLQLSPLENGGWQLHSALGYDMGALERQTSYLNKVNDRPEYSDSLGADAQGTNSANWTGVSRLNLSADGSGAWRGATKAGLFQHFSLSPPALSESAPRMGRLMLEDPANQAAYSWMVSISSTGVVRAVPETPGQPSLMLRLDKTRGEWSGSYVPGSAEDKLRRTVVGAALLEPYEETVRAHGWVELGALPATQTSVWRLEMVSP